jgi:hypothetical protein
MLDLVSASRRRVSVLPWRCFPDVRRLLQHPRPTADPSVPSSPPNAPEDTRPTPPNGTVSKEYVVLNKYIEWAEREVLVMVVYT